MSMNWKIMGFGIALCVPGIYFLARGFDFDPRALPEKWLDNRHLLLN